MENKKVVISIDGKESVSLLVPQGSIVTVEDGITIVEPKIEKYIPNVGDCVKVYNGKKVYITSVVSEINVLGYMCGFNGVIIRNNKIEVVTGSRVNQDMYSFEKITHEELQAEFKKLGYVYDFETNTASKIRWRAKKRGEYWRINNEGVVSSDSDDYAYVDNNRYNFGNYFQTEELAEQFKSIQSKALITFHNQNNG